MRIDPTTSGIEQPDNSKTGRAGQPANQSNQANARAAASAGASTGASATIDRTQFSFDQARVQTLESQVLAAPEIRQAKVSSLEQAIGSGGYSVDAGKVAEAMTAEFSAASFR